MRLFQSVILVGQFFTPLDEYYDEGSAPPDSAAGRFVVNYSAADEKNFQSNK